MHTLTQACMYIVCTSVGVSTHTLVKRKCWQTFI